MDPVREKMNQALGTLVVPKLRKLGFAGQFPHFRRVRNDRAELIVFQFNSAGGSFVVELATLTAEEVAAHWKADLSLDTATAYDSDHRRRLGSVDHGDHWFVFGRRNYELGHDRVESDSHYGRVAQDVARLLDAELSSLRHGA